MAFRGCLVGILFCLAKGSCPNQCSGHGECSVFSRCACWGHFTGADCSEQYCSVGTAWSDMALADDLAHQNAECSNRGVCNRQTGTCECQKGFEGNVRDLMIISCSIFCLINSIPVFQGVPTNGMPFWLQQTRKMLNHARACCDTSTRVGFCKICLQNLVGC